MKTNLLYCKTIIFDKQNIVLNILIKKWWKKKKSKNGINSFKLFSGISIKYSNLYFLFQLTIFNCCIEIYKSKI